MLELAGMRDAAGAVFPAIGAGQALGTPVIVGGSMPAGQIVALVSDADEGVAREVGGLKGTAFSLPDGCLGAYNPERIPPGPGSCRAGGRPLDSRAFAGPDGDDRGKR